MGGGTVSNRVSTLRVCAEGGAKSEIFQGAGNFLGFPWRWGKAEGCFRSGFRGWFKHSSPPYPLPSFLQVRTNAGRRSRPVFAGSCAVSPSLGARPLAGQVLKLRGLLTSLARRGRFQTVAFLLDPSELAIALLPLDSYEIRFAELVLDTCMGKILFS